MPRHLLGEFERTILVALIRLGENAYGVTIRQHLSDRLGRDVAIGAVYATLGRLQDKGYVSSSLGEPTPARGGRAKRFFKIEAPGSEALNRTEREAALIGVVNPAWIRS